MPASKVEIAVPQRGEKKALVDHARHQCARGHGPQAGRILIAGEASGRRRRASSAWPSRRGASRFMTIPTSRGPRRSAP